ncbi:helix-turn-helix domain-containing transcriptional regulator [Alloalcanivorax mobilis]|uniref:helix-turn-helix domain-containing transcriptional regulator n=1 Tax=Alloalcanivorax mobilis TaxID=2019569 RepID=UPI000B5B29D0|nr:transcriptional regulator [Alloalcanivorax mobilis]ASK34733.1 transcriptional regulator [Alcanivorax sp. N3-2A]|tara:strand:+ start:12539 stop:12868 length:330 start_codon:yes stop_codon:yes gene_type:complete
MELDATPGYISYTDATILELQASRAFTVEYLKAALKALSTAERRSAGLLALRDVVEAYGGLAQIARQAGVTRVALQRALSPDGNPSLQILVAIALAVGVRLSVEPGDPV